MTRIALAWLALAAAARMQGAWGVAYPPARGVAGARANSDRANDAGSRSGNADARETKPAIVFLHGMWAGPEESCGAFEQGAAPFGFLVCPRGNAPQGQGRMWAGTYADAARSIQAAIRATTAASATGASAPVLDASRDGTLIGYSNGAYFAAEVAMAEGGRWTGLVLLSMKLDLDATRLKNAGIRRVVLAAGDKDGVRASMLQSAVHLTESGLTTRFLSLGPGGHELPSDISARMCEAIAWAREEPQSDCADYPAH